MAHMTRVTEVTIGAEAIVPLPFTNECAESPFWSPADEAFFWVDIPAGRIHRWSSATATTMSWKLPEQVGCIARQADGNMLAACESGIYTASLQQAEPHVVLRAGIAHPAPHMRFNDGRCDRRGRLWVTTFMDWHDKQPVGGLFRYTPDGLSARLLDGFLTPNGMAFSPDNRTLYIADSHASVRKVWAIDFDLDEGVLGERRVFIDMAAYAGRPDGAAVDTEGCYWVAGMDDGCIMRFTPQGVLDRMIRLPVRCPTMCAFGGKDMKSMFITSLRRSGAAGEHDHLGGSVLQIDPEAQGIAEVAFAA
ncbi:MAG: SMP-30/Gluconolaconase/LRE-like region-containing protein [Rhodocyclales bacterium]|nr:SMP-30/Gluconolaconase/LRE-like region-containing protein [Rhodocyclales bacterium]